jgi:ATP-dependent Clp protease ATP-binding subunit ClpC
VSDRHGDSARKVLGLARQHAIRCEHAWIGSVHILLALLEEPGGIAGRALRQAGLELKLTSQAVQALTPPEGPVGSGQLPLTDDAKQLLERALAVVDTPDGPVDTEQLLLGLLVDGDCAASRVLVALDADPEQLKQSVYALIAAGPVAGQGLEPLGALDADDTAAVASAALRSLKAATELLRLIARGNPPCAEAADLAQRAHDALAEQLPG